MSVNRVPTAIVAGLALIATLAAFPAAASSHREAPFIATQPAVDATDFYMFRSYEPGRDGFVTLVADYIPLQDAYGGPNYFALDPKAQYRINIDNTGDGVEDLIFLFRPILFVNDIQLPIGNETVSIPLIKASPGVFDLNNRVEGYSASLVRGNMATGVEQPLVNRVTGGLLFGKPYDNFGAKTFPDYAGYAKLFVTDVGIPGCGDGRIFVGQRKDPFVVNLGEVFDLVNLNPLGPRDGETDDLADKNVTALEIEVPIDCLTEGKTDVIGGWTTAHIPRNRVLSDDPTFDVPGHDLGRPGPGVAPRHAAGQRAGDRPARQEQVQLQPSRRRPPVRHLRHQPHAAGAARAALRSEGAHQPAAHRPAGDLRHRRSPVSTEFGFGEMQRLNVTIPPTAKANQNDLGVLGGDNAGFPNGRRPGDDVVDAALRVAMGALCHALPGRLLQLQPTRPDGALPYTDGAIVDATFFDNAFPYLKTPIAGSPH